MIEFIGFNPIFCEVQFKIALAVLLFAVISEWEVI